MPLTNSAALDWPVRSLSFTAVAFTDSTLQSALLLDDPNTGCRSCRQGPVGPMGFIHPCIHWHIPSPPIHQSPNYPRRTFARAASSMISRSFAAAVARWEGFFPGKIAGPLRTECVESLAGCRGGDGDLGQALPYGPGTRWPCSKLIRHHRTGAIAPSNSGTETNNTVNTTDRTSVSPFAVVGFTANVQGHAGDGHAPRLAPALGSERKVSTT